MGLRAMLRWPTCHSNCCKTGRGTLKVPRNWHCDSSTSNQPGLPLVQVRQDADLPHHLRHLPGALMMLAVLMQSEVPVRSYQRQPIVQPAYCVSQAAMCALSKGHATQGTVVGHCQICLLSCMTET